LLEGRSRLFTKQDEKLTMLTITLSVLTGVWAITSMTSLILISNLVTRQLNLTLATGSLVNLTISTDTLTLWTGISLASNVFFLYLAVRVTINAMKELVKGKDSD
tara:strand:- start:7221 stop:7535 length:315 start_codon:yes stop_codon:yes gene_type:complete